MVTGDLDDAVSRSATLPEPSGATVVDRNRCPASDGLPSSCKLRPRKRSSLTGDDSIGA